LCDRLGIEHPIVQAGMSIYTSAALVAAVSNAGGLGSLGCWRRPSDDLARQLAMIRERTDRPFALNHVIPDLKEPAFTMTLEARPAFISLALDDPGELVKRVHDAGLLVAHQATTVSQARRAADQGADIIIAQGSESGGYVGDVAAMALIPQVVDAVHPLPVIAAGGIADGRGLAAALVLGAQAVNVGTRFLASREAQISPVWKQMIVDAEAEQVVRAEVINDITPMPGSYGYGTAVRVIRNQFIDSWSERRDEAKRESERLRVEMRAALLAQRNHETLAAAGQSAGLIHEILSVDEIVRRMVDEAEEALKSRSWERVAR
jgi:nitronate monooxygenase/enoyl-[acyl-carrier protein] reductase II